MHRPTSSPHELVDTTTAPSPAVASGGTGPVSVSVVMPVLNEERHLREAVPAVLEQDYAGALEVVIALGPAATAPTRSPPSSSPRDPRVRTVPNPTGRTPGGAERRDRRAPGTPIVVRVDGHGVLDPDYIAHRGAAAGGDGRGQRRRHHGRRGRERRWSGPSPRR